MNKIKAAIAVAFLLVLGLSGVASADHYGAANNGAGFIRYVAIGGSEIIRYIEDRPRYTCLSFGSTFTPYRIENHSDRMVSIHAVDNCAMTADVQSIYPGENVILSTGLDQAVTYW